MSVFIVPAIISFMIISISEALAMTEYFNTESKSQPFCWQTRTDQPPTAGSEAVQAAGRYTVASLSRAVVLSYLLTARCVSYCHTRMSCTLVWGAEGWDNEFRIWHTFDLTTCYDKGFGRIWVGNKHSLGSHSRKSPYICVFFVFASWLLYKNESIIGTWTYICKEEVTWFTTKINTVCISQSIYLNMITPK